MTAAGGSGAAEGGFAGGAGAGGAQGGTNAGDASAGASSADASILDASGAPTMDGGVSTDADDGSPAVTGVDLSGTWISRITTSGKLSVPVVGMTDADIDLIIRLALDRAKGKLDGNFEICQLTTTTKPDPTSLQVTFTPAVLATLTARVSENDFVATVGAAVPIPHITVMSGIDAAGRAVDSDKDSNPGVTIPSNIGGILQVDAYVGLTIDVSLGGKLTDGTTLKGTTSFATTGMVFGSSNPAALMSGTIAVTPDSTSIPFSATRLAGDVACAEVVKKFR